MEVHFQREPVTKTAWEKKSRRKRLYSAFKLFAAAFILGAAMMASPALAVILSLAFGMILLTNRSKE